jgi:hypothetical protein
MKTITAIAASLLVSTPAYADETKLNVEWPQHYVQTMDVAFETAPTDGNTLVWTGVGLTGIGMAGSIYAQTLPTNRFALAMGTEIASSVVSLLGVSLSILGLVKSVQYSEWIQTHPVVAAISGYSVAF